MRRKSIFWGHSLGALINAEAVNYLHGDGAHAGTVTELQSAVRRLPRPEAWQFKTWLDGQMADEWDRQIEAYAQPGKLDPLWQKALTEIYAGRTRSIRNRLRHLIP